ncbi:MAG: hypothetical protein ACFFDT_28060 [Candidatus Hodarchaeota archaeon]
MSDEYDDYEDDYDYDPDIDQYFDEPSNCRGNIFRKIIDDCCGQQCFDAQIGDRSYCDEWAVSYCDECNKPVCDSHYVDGGDEYVSLCYYCRYSKVPIINGRTEDS